MKEIIEKLEFHCLYHRPIGALVSEIETENKRIARKVPRLQHHPPWNKKLLRITVNKRRLNFM